MEKSAARIETPSTRYFFEHAFTGQWIKSIGATSAPREMDR